MGLPDHVNAISRLIRTISKSSEIHALIVNGPAGWGKTTAVENALKSLNITASFLGAYSTPLNFFNFLHENSKSFVLIDDCAGLFSDSASMAILKAATWPQSGRRIIKWGSTSSRATTDEFEFTGKLIIICNTFPSTADAEAVKSRSYDRRIDINIEDAKGLLKEAAKDSKRFKEAKKINAVCEFLCSRLSDQNLNQISYRTLRKGYELAEHNPDDWQEDLGVMIKGASDDPKKFLKKLARQNLKVKDQIREFEKETGMKRRTFFKYRKALNIGR
jgi:hypothetical protein